MGWVVRQNNNYPAYTILNFANMIYIAGHLVTDNNDNPPRRIRGLWTAQVNAIEQSTKSVEQSTKSVEQSIKSFKQSIKSVRQNKTKSNRHHEKNVPRCRSGTYFMD